jgi:hypothetical protein
MVIHFSDAQKYKNLGWGLAKHTLCTYSFYKPILTLPEAIEKE